MSVFRITCSVLLALAYTKAQGTPPTETDCKDSRLLSFINQPRGKALLKAYGYELNSRWTCRELHSTFTTAMILRFQMNKRDSALQFTILQIPGFEQAHVIPISSGVFSEPNRPGDPHNVAAFNLVLQTIGRNPTAAKDWLDLSRLYMSILGMQNIRPLPPYELKDCEYGGTCTVSFPSGPVRDEQQAVWQLHFGLASPKERPSFSVAHTIVDR